MDLVNHFKQEHRHIAKVLNCLADQLRVLERAGNADYALMQSAVHYITLYPDRVHHPNEEIIFAELLRLRPDTADVISELSEQHESLADMSEALEKLIDATVSEHVVERSALVEACRAYLDAQYSHMQKEETEIFPLLGTVFDDSIVEALSRKITKDDDPLFSDTPHENLKLLYQSIIEAQSRPDCQ